nr:hypothetical protein [Yoonia sp.]
MIDDTLLKLLAKKAPGVSHRELLEVRRRVRAVKETLFQLGRIFELGVELKLEELEDAQEVKNMQRQIRSATQEILEINLAKVVEWTEASLFQRQYIEILMAGGGANIGFIQRSLELGFYQVGSSRILAKVVSPASNGNVKTYGATIQRMAVALGGANEGYENLLVSMATASSTYNLVCHSPQSQ